MIPGLTSLFIRSRVVGGFSVTTSVPSVSGVDTGPGLVTSSSVTAIPSGGTAPYTYLWKRASGDPSMAITSSAAASTTFSETLGLRDATSAVFYCQVTDSTARVANSNQITASLRTTGS